MDRIWDKFVTEQDKAVFQAAGYGKSIGYGKRPALVVIDVHYSFISDEPEDILESVKKYRTSCGRRGWDSVKAIEKLLAVFREKNFPIVYTVSERRKDFFDSGVQRGKNFRHEESTRLSAARAHRSRPRSPRVRRTFSSARRSPALSLALR